MQFHSSINVKNNDYGFSIMEALVVLLIGSTLLAILTPVLLTSKRTNSKISEVFEKRSDRIFFDLQMTELLQTLVDPSLRPSAVDGYTGPKGSSSSFEAKAFAPFGLSTDNVDVWMGWTRSNAEEIKANRESMRHGNKLVARIGTKWIVWPQNWETTARFSYMDAGGKIYPTWPPLKKSSSLFTADEANGLAALPMAILIEQEATPTKPYILFVFNVKI